MLPILSYEIDGCCPRIVDEIAQESSGHKDGEQSRMPMPPDNGCVAKKCRAK